MTEPNQATTPASPEASVPVPTEYDAMVAAAKAATAEYEKSKPAATSLAQETAPSAEAAEPSPEKGQSGNNAGEPAPETSADDANTVARLLKAKNRETAQKQRDEADAYLARRRAEADAEVERRTREADERARALERDAEERVRRRIDELTSPEEMLGRQANKADPLFQLAKRFESDLKARDEVIDGMRRELAALREDGQERDRGFSEARTKLAERNFMSRATEGNKYPYAVAYWDGDGELLAKAKAVLSDARAEAEKRGEPFACPDDDVLQFLDAEAKERLTRKRETLSKLLSPVESEPAPEKGNAPRGQKGQTRTLSASAASERRATPKPASEMTEEEAEVAMRQAARDAFRSK